MNYRAIFLLIFSPLLLKASDVLGPEEVPAKTTPAVSNSVDSTPLLKRRPEDPAHWPLTPTAGYGGWSKTTGSTWLGVHTKLENVVKSRSSVEILLMGDALIASLGMGIDEKSVPLPSWKSLGESAKTLNCAQPGECTEQLLWRLGKGLVDSLNPEVVVLGVGANNLMAVEYNQVPVAAVADGIQAVIQVIRARFPKAKIIYIEPFLMGRPRANQCAALASLHDRLKSWAPIPAVKVVDPRESLVDSRGVVHDRFSTYGRLHLNEEGREALVALLAKARKELP